MDTREKKRPRAAARYACSLLRSLPAPNRSRAPPGPNSTPLDTLLDCRGTIPVG
jgi:hypothetical protein